MDHPGVSSQRANPSVQLRYPGAFGATVRSLGRRPEPWYGTHRDIRRLNTQIRTSRWLEKTN